MNEDSENNLPKYYKYLNDEHNQVKCPVCKCNDWVRHALPHDNDIEMRFSINVVVKRNGVQINSIPYHKGLDLVSCKNCGYVLLFNLN